MDDRLKACEEGSRMFLILDGESARSRRVRYAKWWFRYWLPGRLRLAMGRFKFSGLTIIPLPFAPHVGVSPIFTRMSLLEYHTQHCDLTNFLGYCPHTRKSWCYP